MAVWPRTRGHVRPCPFCESTLVIGATACRKCGLPLVDLTTVRSSSHLPTPKPRSSSPIRRASYRLNQERKAIAVAIGVILLSLLGLILTSSARGTDYSGQDLSGAALSSSQLNLVGANFTETQLQRSDLAGQALYAADFYGANLSYADLSGSDATAADFRDANLSNARLNDTSLAGAVFEGANLADTDLTGSDVPMEALAQTYRCRTVMPNRSINSDSCAAD